MKKAPLIALLTANAISMTGNIFAMIAIPWFVLQTTGSPAKTGLTGFTITLAAVVATFFGGAIVDRLGFKITSIIADLASGFSFALIPLLYSTVGLEFWQLILLVFIGNFLDAPGTTAREALIPDLAEAGGVSLEQASSLIQAVERGSRMVGAPLAGMLIAAVGANDVIWVDAISFAVSALIVGLFIPLLHRRSEPVQEKTHYLTDIREGIQFILKDRLMLAIVLVVVCANFLDSPLLGVMYPVYFQRFFGTALDLGLVVSAGGAGALISALIYGAVGRRFSRRLFFFGGFLLATLRFFIYPLVPPIWVLVTVSLIGGLASGPINPIISTVSYERIPLNFRGRVLGTMTSMAYVAMPLGTALAGIILESVDVRAMMLAMGVLYVSLIVLAMFVPALRGLEREESLSGEGNV